MGRLAVVLAVLLAALVSSCGLTLDYSPPDDGGMDAGPRDAALADAPGPDAQEDDAAQPDVDAAIVDAQTDASEDVDAPVGCATDSDCSSGICIRPCDGSMAGRCFVAGACSDAPVCGCDGVVYTSECDAHLAGVEASPDPSTCDDLCTLGEPCTGGQCVTCPGELPLCRPDMFPPCTTEPVCGCDGRSYIGACDAISSGARTFTLGPCPGECASSRDCAPGQYCERATCDAPFGACSALPPVSRVPECGCSGRRYLDGNRALIRDGLLGACDLCSTRPAGCCADAADCPHDHACVGNDLSVCAGNGTCVDLTMIAVLGACWTDADCDPGFGCIGARICECGALCILPDEPGVCITR